MHTPSKGFIAPLLLALIAFLLLGGGAYVYQQTKPADQPVTATSTTQVSNESASTLLADVIGKNEGKYPSDIKLFSNQEISSRLKTLLGTTYETVVQNFTVQTPIVGSQGIYKVTGCVAHACPSYFVSIYFDVGKDNINVVIDQNGVIEKFQEKGLVVIPTAQILDSKIIIQELVLDDGSYVRLTSSEPVLENPSLTRIYNCSMPEIVKMNVALEYKGNMIPLGFIGVPKKAKGEFPVIQNVINRGLENREESFRWSPLQKLARGFGVVDYSTVTSIDPKSTGSLPVFQEACYLHYRMQFFEIDQTTKSLKLIDTGNGTDLYENLERFKKEIAPGCSPFGCG